MVIADEASPVGVICANLCGSANPCGNRGKCYVPSGSSTALCCDCISPFTNDGDNTCTCSAQNGLVMTGGGCSHSLQCATGNCIGADCPANEPCIANSGTCIGDAPITSKCGEPCTPINKQPIICGNGAGGYTCPAQTTCCFASTGTPDPSGVYSCCPFDNAVCCSDGVHCCPNGKVCNIGTQSCTDADGTNSVPWSTNS